MSSSYRSKIKLFFFRIFLFLGIVGICFLILEGGVRLVAPPPHLKTQLPFQPHLKMKLNVRLRGIPPKVNHTTNRWGFRGDEPPKNWDEAYTIVAVGGSTTLCFYLDDAKTWPAQLQKLLQEKHPQVWVGNAGLDGHSTRGHLAFMKEVLPQIKPDLVVFLVGINDLGFSVNEGRRVHGNPYDQVSWQGKLRSVLFQSRLIQILYQWKLVLWDKVLVVEKQSHSNYLPKPLKFTPDPLPSFVHKFLPGLDEYRENIRTLARMAQEEGVRAVFLTQPLLYQNNEFWNKMDGGLYWIRKVKGKISAAQLAVFLDIYNQELLKVCEEEKLSCYDLAPEVPRDLSHFYDVVHFTDWGARSVAQKVSEFLEKEISEWKD